jgi:hypothetical protein
MVIAIINMKALLLFSLLFLSSFIYSQEKRMNYYFDNYTISNYKNYNNGYDGQVINFNNTKDSTYKLLIRINKNLKDAILTDLKNKLVVKFDVNFIFNKIQDLNKLNNRKLFSIVDFDLNTRKKYKNFVEEFEFEKDSTTGKIIAHLTSFKNNKRKKIINEHYYFFEKNDKVINNYKNSTKLYLINKYNIKLDETENVQKILCIIDGKISNETEILEINQTDFNFNFKIDEEYLERISFSRLITTTIN